jgi:glycine dehydrogenase subunit 1
VSYLVHNTADRTRMLEAVDVDSIEELFASVPEELRLSGLDLPAGLSELETREQIESLAARNKTYGSHSFLGAGAYNHLVPAAVPALISRAEFLTAYTPCQAEVSQGTLQHIFEFQTAICELTGLAVANASLYDGPSALAEGVFLALRHTRRERAVVSRAIHPEAGEVLTTYASGPGVGLEWLEIDRVTGRTRPPGPTALADAGALVIQQPNFFGVIEDLGPFAEAARAAGALFVVSQDPLTTAVLASPGSQGADVAVGDVQVFGNPLSFGGPYAGYLAAREDYIRQIPGRLVGETTDLDGRRSYALTLQAREQHIRRARATSNVCTNQALNALAAVIYLSLAGPVGLAEVAEAGARQAHRLREHLLELPRMNARFSAPFLHEFVLELPLPAADFAKAMRARGVDPGVPLGRFDRAWERLLLVAVTEVNPPSAVDEYIASARDVVAADPGGPQPPAE